MQEEFQTKRLTLSPINVTDAAFILELYNTPGWIQFIGDRNIKSADDALAYIQNLQEMSGVGYWVVRTKSGNETIGIVTFIRHDYLEHRDIGYALLPQFEGKGYAFEVSSVVLDSLLQDPEYSFIYAVTLEHNIASIKLIEKLGLSYLKNVEANNESLHVYSRETDRTLIDQLTLNFYQVFNNKFGPPEFEKLYQICLPEVHIIKTHQGAWESFTLNSFLAPRAKILTDGTLVEFEELETESEIRISNNIAQRHSRFVKSGILNGKRFVGGGNKMIQFIKTSEGWKISSILWEEP